jgi:hypothetical protein
MNMTTLHEYRENQPDKLILNAIVTLTTEQEEFITKNIEDSRPILFKKFKLRFSSHINKFQFNFAVEKVKENIIKNAAKQPRKAVHKHDRPDVERVKNVNWSTEQGNWYVKFKVKGKNIILGKFDDHEKAKKVAAEYRKKLA